MFLTQTKFDNDVKVWSGSDTFSPINVNNGWGQILLNELYASPADQIIQINHNTGRTITCSEMRLKANKFAEILKIAGIRSQDNITIICSHHDDLVSVVIGSLTIGAIINPLDISFTTNEMIHFLKMTLPNLVICDRDILDRVQASLRSIGHGPKILIFGESVSEIESIDNLLMDFESTMFAPTDITDSEQIAFITCSSGTTGTPKGVLLSHSMVMNGLKMWWHVNSGEIYFSTSNILWITCFGIIAHSILYRCPRIIVDASKPITPNLILDVIIQHKVSVMYISPSSAMGLLKLLECSNDSVMLPSVRLLVSGGSHVSDQLIQSINHFLPNGKMFASYGMTEVCGFIASSEMSYRKDSVGQLAPDIDVVINDDTNRRLGPLEIGEICVKPRNFRIMGYFNNEAENHISFDVSKWFRTGDIGYFDEQGFLYLIDRRKLMMKYCSFQISPNELEQYIESNFPVDGVCVVGIDDEKYGQLPAAVIARRNDAVIFSEDAVTKLIADNFSDAKRLRGGVFFVENLPITNSGKIQRKSVREIILNLRKN